MRNRIRDYRQRHAMTQGELAEKVGTTPQTISRLEGGNMTLSTDWLTRFADVFHIHPTDLLEQPSSKSIPIVAHVLQMGMCDKVDSEVLTLDTSVKNPLALKVIEAVSGFCRDDILVCEELDLQDISAAYDRDCFVRFDDETALLARVVQPSDQRDDEHIFIPLCPNQSAIRHKQIRCIAPLRMRVSYYS